MRRADIAAGQLAPAISGLFDVVFAFAIVLERRGLLSRADIAETLRTVQVQIAEQEGPASARAVIAELMIAAFDLPTAGPAARARFTVIDGKPAL